MPSWSMDELAGWSGGNWIPPGRSAVSGVTGDTRTIQPGNLYVALKGDRFDGHDFIDEAFRKGAAGAMVNRGWHNRQESKDGAALSSRAFLCVDDTRRALGALGRGHRRRTGARITAVTGSAGKSSVKGMIASMLGTKIRTASSRGNWNNDIGLPLSLLAMEPEARAGVFEVGMNHPGELAGLCDILEPDCGVVTNVGSVHIEFFNSVADIAREKATVLSRLPPDGLAVLNRDTECFDVLRSMAHGRAVTVSMRQEADYRCVRRRPEHNEAEVEERAGGETHTLAVGVPGEHNILNAILAAAVAREYGISWDDIQEGLRLYSPLPMRWERQVIAGVTVINDAYNANPMSMSVALRTFAESEKGKNRWLVLGGMLELGSVEEAAHVNLGREIGAGSWKGLATIGRLGGWIADGAVAAGFPGSAVWRCQSNAEAAQVLADRVRRGDAMLLKASRGIRLEEVIQMWRAMAEK